MNTEELKKLGLSDEQAKNVLVAYGQAVNPLKEQVNSLTTERDGLNGQLETVNGQLNDIKKSNKDNQDLHDQIEKLQADNKAATDNYQAELTRTKIDYQTDLALTQAGAKNLKATKALLDADKLSLDKDGHLVGLDDQLAEVRKANDYLFQEQASQLKTPTITTGGNPNPDNTSSKSIVEKIQERLGE